MESVNKQELIQKIKEMYKDVAEHPEGKFHFEMDRQLAEKLGYPSIYLDKIPKESIESFAGVGYYFDLADIKEGEQILDLGSGSGMDSFFAGLKTGKNGKVIGIDMTNEQLQKATKIKNRYGFSQIQFIKGYLESLPVFNNSVDVVISNGVINLCADKEKVFREIARVLKKGGRMAISDIVTEKPLTKGITCDVNLWASCIGGAMQIDAYKKAIEQAGLKIIKIKEHPEYNFLSKSAQGASKDFGVKSISILAVKK
ncbi:methyltransferase domain-containing protein [Candidatus Pacearchaeota archaeon]|nr:methyltransferase domain-containing protein [Candidatus Pacearchaeota archaeon]